MDLTISCGICAFEVSADEVDGPGAEHLAQLFTAAHTEHTPAERNSFVWANGAFPFGPQHRGGDTGE